MSDVIQSVGPHRDVSGKRAEVKWIGDGVALGFDSDGDPCSWSTSGGHYDMDDGDSEPYRLDITGPWIPDPPEPPVGFVVMPQEYVAKEGDVLWDDDDKHWVPATGAIGYSTDQMNSRWSDPPYYIASTISKPFSISDHGPGVYETRDGREATVDRKDGPGLHPWSGTVDCGSKGVCRLTWMDCGTWRASYDRESTHDLVRYLRPLPKPAVDPEEGWRLLGDEEVVQEGDDVGLCSGTITGWVGVGNSIGRTVREVRDSYGADSHRAFARRRVTPPAPQEWTPTNELRWVPCNGRTLGSVQLYRHFQHGGTIEMPTRLEQKWTCGEKSEWRPVPVEGA